MQPENGSPAVQTPDSLDPSKHESDRSRETYLDAIVKLNNFDLARFNARRHSRAVAAEKPRQSPNGDCRVGTPGLPSADCRMRSGAAAACANRLLADLARGLGGIAAARKPRTVEQAIDAEIEARVFNDPAHSPRYPFQRGARR